MLGYYKNAEATAQIIDKDGWLHTGDLATIDEQGYVTIRGRSKNLLLNSSGQNIYPEEIESKLNNMPYVAESLIVLQNDKLVALIYPDFDDAFAHGLQQPDIEKAMEANRLELNLQLPAFSQISKVKIHFEEFEKTAKKSIKRFMVSRSERLITLSFLDTSLLLQYQCDAIKSSGYSTEKPHESNSVQLKYIL